MLANNEFLRLIVFEDTWDPISLESILGRIALLERLYDYSQYVGDRLLEAGVLLWLGRSKDSQSFLHPSRTRFWAEARLLYERSLGLARSLRDKQLIAEILSSLAFIEWHYKNYVATIQLMKESLKYQPRPRACRSLEQIHETDNIAMCLSSLSELEYLTGDIRRASRHCKRCLRLLVQVKNADREWEKANLSFTTSHYARQIILALHLLGQIYEAQMENRKATIVYGLLRNCSPDFKAYKGDRTVTELLNGIGERVGQRRFKRYQREVAELGLVADKNVGASVYKVLDIVNDKLLASR